MPKDSSKLIKIEAIYYTVRLPVRWKIFVHGDIQSEAPAHVEFWESQLSGKLAQGWAPTLNLTESELLSRITNYPYAFPRGRVVKRAGKYIVYHGDDLEPFMKISKRMIEKAFRIVGRARWELDEHERCQREDKEIVREVLGLRENWKDAG